MDERKIMLHLKYNNMIMKCLIKYSFGAFPQNIAVLIKQLTGGYSQNFMAYF